MLYTYVHFKAVLHSLTKQESVVRPIQFFILKRFFLLVF